MRDKAGGSQRPWDDLPRYVILKIFHKLGALGVLIAAPGLWSRWSYIAMEPEAWHSIDLILKTSISDCAIEMLSYEAVRRSDGHIEEFIVGGFIWDILLYVVERTSGLRKLVLVAPRGFLESDLVELITRSPLLEELEITDYSVSSNFYAKLGAVCPSLKRFRFNKRLIIHEGWDFETEERKNREAMDIAENFSQINELQILGNPMTSKGLEAIVDKCVNLQLLDVRDCYGIFYGRTLKAKMDKIQLVRLPYQQPRAELSTSSEAGERNWMDLPPNVVFNMFEKLGVIEVLLAGRAVCHSWREIALHPDIWRRVDLSLHPHILTDRISEMVIGEAIARAKGYIEEFRAEGFIWDASFSHIASSSSALKRLSLISPRGFTGKSLLGLICKCPMLEELELVDYSFPMPEDHLPDEFWSSMEPYADIGRACPKLKYLRIKRRLVLHDGWYSSSNVVRDRDAVEIAGSMPQLLRLELVGNPLSNAGLLAILKSCPQLESINFEGCYNIRRTPEVEGLLKLKKVVPPQSDSVKNLDAAFVRSFIKFLPWLQRSRRSYMYQYD